MNTTPDEVKLKVTSVLAQIAQQEQKYRTALDHNAGARPGHMVAEILPQLMDLGFVNRNKALLWVTVEPFTKKTTESGIQGWDDHRQIMWTFKWYEIWDASLNNTTYMPADKKEWERRIQATNLQDVEENWVRQSVARYR